MARRSKEDALATRNRLLDCAELLFQEQGVSRTSLNDIAQAAGTTRGAIYWHFKDKADLFNAMMERVTLPMEQALERSTAGLEADTLEQMRAAMAYALDLTANDERTRRVFEVATHKVEYVEELNAVRQRHRDVRDECLGQMARTLQQAALRRGVKLPIPAAAASQGLHALIDGLIQNWLLDPQAFDLPVTGKRAFDVYVAGLGLGALPKPAARAAAPRTRRVIPA
jgi:TetR/AcrR family transcriptional regulator, acrAB operon repressor